MVKGSDKRLSAQMSECRGGCGRTLYRMNFTDIEHEGNCLAGRLNALENAIREANQALLTCEGVGLSHYVGPEVARVLGVVSND